jgi:hypothetical protein
MSMPLLAMTAIRLAFTIIIISSPAMSTPLLAVIVVGFLLTNSTPQCYALVARQPLACF